MKRGLKRIPVSVKTLVKIAAVMCIVFFSFNAGYLKSQYDFSRHSNTYTVTSENEVVNKTEAKPEVREEIELININTATVEELERLDGIGPVLAGRIVEYREKNGDFKHLFSIMDVSGIGAGIYEEIKDEICIE